MSPWGVFSSNNPQWKPGKTPTLPHTHMPPFLLTHTPEQVCMWSTGYPGLSSWNHATLVMVNSFSIVHVPPCVASFFFFLLCRSYIRDSCTVMFLRTHRQHQLIGLICLCLVTVPVSSHCWSVVDACTVFLPLSPHPHPVAPLPPPFFPLLPQMDRMNFLSFLLLCLTSVAIGNKGQFLILLTVNCEVLRWWFWGRTVAVLARTVPLFTASTPRLFSSTSEPSYMFMTRCVCVACGVTLRKL